MLSLETLESTQGVSATLDEVSLVVELHSTVVDQLPEELSELIESSLYRVELSDLARGQATRNDGEEGTGSGVLVQRSLVFRRERRTVENPGSQPVSGSSRERLQ